MSRDNGVTMAATVVAGAAVIRALAATWRMHREHVGHFDAARAQSPNIIYAFWHGRLLPLLYAHRDQGIHVLASRHRDGEMLGRVIRRFGYGHVRGSSTRGGAAAIRQLARVLESGDDVGITVDGPRGPARVVKPGVIDVARLTGSRVIPLTSASVRRKVFSSWDAFELPAPFTRVEVVYGPPVFVPRDATPELVEDKRRALEDTLNAITDEADGMCHG
jgi:lysophospholipid acyltransferase (LPLAT)-like uncharacterized protein